MSPLRVPDRLPLGLKLISALVVLLAIALVVTGVAGTIALRGYLIERLDDQLHGIYNRNAHDLDDSARSIAAHNRDAGEASLYVRYDPTGEAPIAALSRAEGSRQAPPDLPQLDARTAEAFGSEPFTVHAQGAGHDWRVVTRPLPDGRGTLTVAVSLDNVDGTMRRLIGIDVGTGVVVLLLLAALGYAMVRSSLRPLREVEETAAAIADGDLGQRIRSAGERTEVGRLANALNSMLAQIESAFAARERSEASARASEDRMRRFVADASHELRTPLTSIRGFAELYRQGAVSDRAATDRAMRKIEAEATRMGLLVEDLMLLARLDQQRPLERKDVDLLQLAIDAVEASRLGSPDHPVGLRIDADAPLTVVGDSGRLRQVLDNLLSNATTHTPPGTQVQVLLSAAGDRAVVAVADAGPGLTPEQAGRVFERFYRTDPARSRAVGGSGLGLSIVDALVAAHGGEVGVESTPGEGATFRVSLPLAPGSWPTQATGEPDVSPPVAAQPATG